MPKPTTLPRWPYRTTEYQRGGYVVWRDVFEGDMRCSLDEAMKAHKVATFVTEQEALNYAEYRNAMTEKYGTDDVGVISFDADTVAAERERCARVCDTHRRSWPMDGPATADTIQAAIRRA